MKRFYGMDGSVVSDVSVMEDWRGADVVGMLRLGQRGCYFTKGLKNCCVFYTEIDRAFERIREVTAGICCGAMKMAKESVVLWGKEGELAELAFPQDGQASRVLAMLAQKNSSIRIGKA